MTALVIVSDLVLMSSIKNNKNKTFLDWTDRSSKSSFTNSSNHIRLASPRPQAIKNHEKSPKRVVPILTVILKEKKDNSPKFLSKSLLP